MIDFNVIPSPCYVMEEKLLRNNLALIKSVKERAGVNIILAFKAFALWKSFPIVREYIPYSTASSKFEAQLAFEEMGSPAHTYSPAYTEMDFPTILKYSSHVTFNSLSQFERFYPMVKADGNRVSCGLRINPEYSDVETELYNPCAPGSRMGIIADLLGEKLPEGVEGLHFHTLCESTSFDLEKTLGEVEKRFGRFLPHIKWLNMGGGHLMTRKGYDTEHLISLLHGLEMPYKPVIRNATDPVEGKPTYRIGGNSCLSGDYMGDWSFDEPLKIGDKIVFEDMIHYTIVKTSMFNGIPHPSLALWSKDDELVVYRTFGYEDYKGRNG